MPEVTIPVVADGPVAEAAHWLRQSGYPENVGHRDLNLCTQIVTIADVYVEAIDPDDPDAVQMDPLSSM